MHRRQLLQLTALSTLGVMLDPLQRGIQSTSTINPEKRKIPSTQELLPIVGMGTWRTFNTTATEKKTNLKKVMENLSARGGTVIDSSPMYGSSETVVGELSEQTGLRSKLFLATKVWTEGRSQGIGQMNESFARMKTKVMDLMQVHNLVDVHTHIKTIRDWKAEGRIRYFGFTHYLPSAYNEMIKLIKNEKPDFVQFNYNISSREAEKTLLPMARDNGVAVIINRPFEEGQLFPMVNGKTIPVWSKEYDINNWAQFFLKFILSHKAVTCTIPATTNPQHLLENMGASTGQLPDEKGRSRMVEYFNSIT